MFGKLSFGRGLAAAAAMVVASSAEAAVIAYWDYNDSNLIVDQGAGTMTVGGRSPVYGAGTTLNAQPGVLPANAFAVSGGAPFTIDFAIDTRGFTNLRFDYALRADPTWVSNQIQPGGVQVTYDYSIDGGATFIGFVQFTPPADFIAYGFNLPVAMLEQEDAVFRILQSPSFTSAADFFLIDNITFSGVGAPPPPPAVAEPAALATFGLGLVALGWLRRRRVI